MGGDTYVGAERRIDLTELQEAKKGVLGGRVKDEEEKGCSDSIDSFL